MYSLPAENDFQSRLIQSVSELPDPLSITRFYMDVETVNNTQDQLKSHGKESNAGLYPFLGDKIAGFGFTWDDHPTVYYVPIAHTGVGKEGNIDNPEGVFRWLADVLANCKEWVNHSILLDAMFAHFEGAPFKCRLIDTLTLAKIHDSDRLGHALKPLCRDWLDLSMEDENRIKEYLKAIKSKSYSDLPVDLCGQYCCMDVHGNRALMIYLEEHRPEDLEGIWETEILLTPVLFDMELEGLRIDPVECKKDSLKCLRNMIILTEEIESITDREWTNSNACIFDMLVNQFGIPILVTKKERGLRGQVIDTGRPTFDKDALQVYGVHPTVTSDPRVARLVELILSYRVDSQHKSLFLDSFLGLCDSEFHIHPSYNQIVRTGRMSCRRPNAQQQNYRSKSLIYPDEGFGFISNDYSQIEYRLIVHYINDLEAIRAYNEDPTTDFHQWVADMLGISRDAGKTINFGMAYGAGKALVTRNLASNPVVIEEVGEIVNDRIKMGLIEPSQRIAVFTAECANKASETYEDYHERFPGIKRTATKAAEVCRYRGYVKNPYGRRRHLPRNAAHKAFNSIIQGGAMDIMKEGMIRVAPRYNSDSRRLGLTLKVNVHDELLTQVPLDTLYDPTTHRHVMDILENPSVKFRVPIRADIGISSKSWALCSADAHTVNGKQEGQL